MFVPRLNKGLVYDPSEKTDEKMICSGNKGHQDFTSATIINTNVQSSSIFLLTNQCEREWGELVAITFIELVLELHPVKPQRVKECAQGLHNKQDTNRGKDEDDGANNKGDNIVQPTRNNGI